MFGVVSSSAGFRNVLGDSGDEESDASRYRVGDRAAVGVDGTEVEMWSMCLCNASCWLWRSMYFCKAKARSRESAGDRLRDMLVVW